MKEKIVYIEETDSTNRWLREHGGDEDCVVWANYQTDGHGQGSNHWESERGKNLTFSVLMHPTQNGKTGTVLQTDALVKQFAYAPWLGSFTPRDFYDMVGRTLTEMAAAWNERHAPNAGGEGREV